MPHGRDVDDIRVRGIDHDAAHVMRLFQAEIDPRLSRVHTLINAIAPG
jgi:hypothetical protein